MAKIKAQLDTFKSEDRGHHYATLQKAFVSPASSASTSSNKGSTSSSNPVKTPTVPNIGDSTLHPNTPNYGFEFSTPPNLKTSASANYFPILTSAVTSSSDPRSSTSSHGDTDSTSPMSSSPNRTSPFTTTTTASTNSSAASSKLPPFLPLMTSTAIATTPGSSGSRSGSPTTLSPASSNRLAQQPLCECLKIIEYPHGEWSSSLIIMMVLKLPAK